MAEVVGLAASIIAILQLAGKVTVLGYEFISASKRGPNDIRELISELNSLSQVLLALQDQSTGSPSPQLQKLGEKDGLLEKCTHELQELEKKLGSGKKRDRFLWVLKEKEIMEHINRIERFKSHFSLAMASDQIYLSKSIETGVQGANTAVEALQNSIQAEKIAKKRKKILNWLYAQKFDEKHLETSGRRQENTGEWLLKTPEFQDLVKGQAGSRLLWGYGIPGAGKSFLSSLVIDHLHGKALTENYGVAYIYFDYKEQSRQTATNVLGSLVKQLLSQISYMPKEIEGLYDKISHRRPTAEELYTVLLVTLASFVRVFFVFDALDECDPSTQRKELLPLFHRFGKSGANLFLTSRQYPEDIQHSLRDAAKIELTAKKEDITVYIESRINENLRASRLVQRAKCKEKIISEILDCSQGMFLLVRFHIEHICQQTTANQLLKALKNLKSASTGERPLDPTYARAMENIRRQGRDSANLALKVLSWLVKATRTLTVEELQIAVSIEPHQYELNELDLPDKETLVEVCASLVTIDGNSNTIHLAHYTVQEYLVENSGIPADANLQIAIACTTFLLFDIFARLSPIKDEDSYKSRLDSHPFLSYAAEQLHVHLQPCDDDSLTDMVLKLLQAPGNSFSYWQITRLRRVPGSFQCIDVPPPLHVASTIGYRGAIHELLRNGSYLVPDNDGLTALHTAAGWGNEAVVQLLLDNGVDSSIKNNDGHTALHLAICQKNMGVIRVLLENGADPEIPSNGVTALHMAVSIWHVGIVQLLLEKGADLSARDVEGEQALHISAGAGHDGEITRILLERGANCSVQDRRGRTALHIAARWKNKEIVRILLENGADPSIQDNDGQTALYTALATLSFGKGDEVVRVLLENRADSSTPNYEGKIALHAAAQWGNEEMALLLLEKGTDHSACDNEGQTPLYLAASKGYINMVELLLRAGADFSIANKSGQTALEVAVNQGHEAVAQLLLDKGAEFSAPHEDWRVTVRSAASKVRPLEELIVTYGPPRLQVEKMAGFSKFGAKFGAFIEHWNIWPFQLFTMFKLFFVCLVMVFFSVYTWFL